jgi:hypothetical protein
MGASGRVLHTVSRHRRPDDSSDSGMSDMSEDDRRSPQAARYKYAGRRTAAVSGGGGSQPMFDSHFDIRSIRRASASGTAGLAMGSADGAAHMQQMARLAQPRATAAAAGPSVHLSLGQQLEELAEEDSD